MIGRLRLPGGPWILLLTWLLLSACTGGPGFGRAGYELRSIVDPVVMRPHLTTSVYAYEDENTADIYLTDLTPEQIRRVRAGSLPAGNIAHIHVFIRPRAGQTPIDPTAMTATVTHAVLAGEAVGVYAGGGFFQPTSETGDRVYAGTLSGATLRLERASDGFRDLLGATTLHARVRARLDPAQAEALRIAMRACMSRAEAPAP